MDKANPPSPCRRPQSARRKQDSEDGGSGQPVDGWRVKRTRGEGIESGVCVCVSGGGWGGGVTETESAVSAPRSDNSKKRIRPGNSSIISRRKASVRWVL